MENTKDEKYEWSQLNSDTKKELVLKLQSEGYTKSMIKDLLNANSERAINEFMNTVGYESRKGIYKIKYEILEEEKNILLEKQKELNCIIDTLNEKEKNQLDQNNKMLDIIKEYQNKERENQNQLVSLINDDKAKNERVLSIIEYYMAQTANIQNNNTQAAITTQEGKQKEEAIDVTNLELPIPVKPDDFVDRKTVRVSYRIYNNFNDLCKSKFPRYKQQDLVSLALQMFIDKYK